MITSKPVVSVENISIYVYSASIVTRVKELTVFNADLYPYKHAISNISLKRLYFNRKESAIFVGRSLRFSKIAENATFMFVRTV